MTKKTTLKKNPLDVWIPGPKAKGGPQAPTKKPSETPQEAPQAPKDRITVSLDTLLADRLKNLAWYERVSVSSVVEAAIQGYLNRAERASVHKGPYPPREEPTLPK